MVAKKHEVQGYTKEEYTLLKKEIRDVGEQLRKKLILDYRVSILEMSTVILPKSIQTIMRDYIRLLTKSMNERGVDCSLIKTLHKPEATRLKYMFRAPTTVNELSKFLKEARGLAKKSMEARKKLEKSIYKNNKTKTLFLSQTKRPHQDDSSDEDIALVTPRQK